MFKALTLALTALTIATPAMAQDAYNFHRNVLNEKSSEHRQVLREEKASDFRPTPGGYFGEQEEEIKRERERPLFPRNQRQDSLFAPVDRGENSLGY